MNKKRLLFVSNNLKCGGVQKSLLSLLSNIDYKVYEVDLILFKQEGVWMNQLPKEVNLLPAPDYLQYIVLPREDIMKCFREFLRKRNFNRMFQFSSALLQGLIIRNMGQARQRLWKRTQKGLPKLEGNYEAAIAFSGKLGGYFIIDKVNARKKINWIHSDYRVFKNDEKIDRFYFSKFDHIVTVSRACQEIFIKIFPEYTDKTTVMHNIISSKSIKLLAKSESGFQDHNFKGTRIISVSRLDPDKGFDIAVPVCARLIEEGYDIRWYVLGDGPEKERLNNLIKEYGLEGKFILLGLKPNPYPYMKEASIFVHPSRFEGKSVAIDEAKALCKPIVVTDYPTVGDQIQNKMNGIIVPISEEGIYEGVRNVISDFEVQQRLIRNLSTENIGNEDEVNKLYSILT